MSFDADWLSLREPHDARARAQTPLAALAGWAADRAHLDIVDLGCGTGSTLRFLAPCLPAVAQRWTLVDNDQALLDRVAIPDLPHGSAVTTRRIDLAQALDEVPWPAGGLVTGSALIDLVSRQWIDRLADRCAGAGATLYMSLSFTGAATWLPQLAGDRAVVAAIDAHQRGDKGFGPALGPDAHQALATAMAAHGYRVAEGSSDWSFGPIDGDIQRRLIADWADAAASLDDPPDDLSAWRDRRLAMVDRARFYVGHACLFAWPEQRR